MDRSSNHSHSRIIQKILDSEMRDSPNNYSNYQNEPLFPDYNNQENEESVEMVIEVDSERSATLIIKPGDNPTNLAQKFCFQHNIDPRIITALSNNIKNIQNTQFRHKQSTNTLNMNTSILQKQNQSGYMNTSLNQSSKMNQSFKYKGQRQSLNKPSSINQYNSNSTATKKFKNNNDTTLMSNDCQRQSVFDRLYQDSKRKKNINNLVQSRKQNNCIMTLVRPNSIQKQSNNNSINLNQSSTACLMIYDKNTKAKQQSLLKRQLQYQLQKQKQIESCTFKPQINPISDLITQKLRRNPYGNDRSKQKQFKKIKEYLNEKQIQQMKQCTFQPKILSKSKLQQTKTERFQLLYEDHYIRETKRKQIDKKLSDSRNKCAPKINSITSSIVKDKSFAQRLRQDQNKRVQRKIQIEELAKVEYTGRPSTGRAPKSRDRSKSVGERLYNNRKSSQKFEVKRAQTPKICKKSEQLYEVNKKTAFRYIFTLMDSDEDGFISHTKINIGGLGEGLLRLVMPLLIQLEQVKAELDQQEFVQSFDRLFNTFNVLERQIVLNVFKHMHHSHNSQEPSFQPSLNEKSLSWARQCRPYRVDMYELAKQQQQRKQAKYYQIRALKQLQQMQECTFHPMLFK